MISGANEEELELANARADILLLEQENEKLKKQTEEYKDGYFSLSKENIEYVNKLHKYKSQQKEFIKYLEEEIQELEKNKKEELDYDILKDIIPELLTYNEILWKYKEIIGDVEDENKR